MDPHGWSGVNPHGWSGVPSPKHSCSWTRLLPLISFMTLSVAFPHPFQGDSRKEGDHTLFAILAPGEPPEQQNGLLDRP